MNTGNGSRGDDERRLFGIGLLLEDLECLQTLSLYFAQASGRAWSGNLVTSHAAQEALMWITERFDDVSKGR